MTLHETEKKNIDERSDTGSFPVSGVCLPVLSLGHWSSPTLVLTLHDRPQYTSVGPRVTVEPVHLLSSPRKSRVGIHQSLFPGHGLWGRQSEWFSQRLTYLTFVVLPFLTKDKVDEINDKVRVLDLVTESRGNCGAFINNFLPHLTG